MSVTHSRFSKQLPKTPNTYAAVELYSSDVLDSIIDDGDGESDNKRGPRRSWTPLTLRFSSLGFMALVTMMLIATVVWIFIISESKQGLLFSRDINDLPLSKTFAYLYLPTMLSVFYSFLWAWIDLDVRRLEPYFQMSKSDGVRGHSSLFLSYPLEFLMALPFLALKNKHWVVFCTALNVILVFWGLTPTQAGIFATRIVTVVEETPTLWASAYESVDRQGNMSTVYAQSVHNIAWLNESLPPFMSKDYILRGFATDTVENAAYLEWTYEAATTMYSVDVECENVVLWDGPRGRSYNTSSGCSFYAPPIRPYGGNDTSKPFDTMYVGYQNQDGAADYYLSSSCNTTFLHSFFIRWSESTTAAILSGNLSTSIDPSMSNMTALFCTPNYYQQEVNASVHMPSRRVNGISATGLKAPLPADMFNATAFEWLMSAASDISVRSDYPTTTFPNQKTHLIDTALNLAYLPKMAPFAIAMNQQPLPAYLDPETLRSSYQAAYRLLFSRQLSDILLPMIDSVSNHTGVLTYSTEAIVVVPVFAYAAIAILALVLIITIGLAIKVPRRRNRLRADPSTIGAVMDLVAGDQFISKKFSGMCELSSSCIEAELSTHTFKLEAGPQMTVSLKMESPKTTTVGEMRCSRDSPEVSAQNKGHRPFEMKLVIGLVFLALQLAAIVAFAVLFAKAKREEGLALPSQSTFVRQLLENYIPIGLATFIEPFWLILNRLHCLLQPYEQLRRGSSPASRSVDIDYASLPPQFLFWRAARAKHWLVFSLCWMVLSANVLSVALSGLMYEDTRSIATDVEMRTLQMPQFTNLNGLGLPFNTKLEGNWQGGTTSDQFYHLMSNLTADTPLPPWIDDDYAYIALDMGNTNASVVRSVQTMGFGASAHCRPLDSSAGESFALEFNDSATNATLEVTVKDDNGSVIRCKDNQSKAVVSYRSLRSFRDVGVGHRALEIATMLTSNLTSEEDLFCRQHILAGWLRADLEQDGDKLMLGLPVMNIKSRNDTVVVCRPTIETIAAELEVDSSGRVLTQISSRSVANTSASFRDLIAQVHQFIPDMGATWHSDSYPSDFLNYLITQSTGDSSMLAASLPAPEPAHASAQMSKLYRKLFAILIGTNQDLLLEPDISGSVTPGRLLIPETRILFSTPAFVVVEAIFACYILFTIVFYGKRPWRILPRLPSSIASNIAFFAPSHALQDLANLQHSSLVRPRAARQAWTWAYGSINGVDGQPHVGIDRDPFVSLLMKNEKAP